MFKYPAEGHFQEVEFGKDFSFRKTTNPWALSQGLEYEIDVRGGVRFCKLLKTVAYVCIDENSEGKAILDKWKIKGRIDYLK
jgi:hypothetical protein